MMGKKLKWILIGGLGLVAIYMFTRRTSSPVRITPMTAQMKR